MYGTFAATAPALSGRKARIAILSMFAIVVCSIVALTSMLPETHDSSSELRQSLATQSVTGKQPVPAHAPVSDNVDHLQIKWQKDEAALKADRAVLRKEEAAFAKDMQQVQNEVGLQRKIVTDDKNLENVELSQLPNAEYEYHQAAAEAFVEPDTHSVYLLDARQNQEAAVEREIRDQQNQLKQDITAFRQHKHVQLDVNKEAALLSAEEKKLEEDKAKLKSDIAKAGKQIKASKITNAMLASDWSKTVNNLEEIKKVESEVEDKRRQISVKPALKGSKPKTQPGGKPKGEISKTKTKFSNKASSVTQRLSEDDEEHSGTYEAATDSKAAAGIAGFGAAEMGGYHGAPTVFGAIKTKGIQASPAVKQHLSEDDEEHSGTYEAATDSRAAAAMAGFAAADVAGEGGKACHGENCGPSVFGAKKSPSVSKARSAPKSRLTSASFVQQQRTE
jgi:hypothetical protein